MPLVPGDKAPSFALASQTGDLVKLEQLLAKGPLVVFFYPKDHTLGCTAEACAFRDHYEDFLQAGASVVGISDDSVQSHRSFVQKHGFQYQLLSDPGGVVRKQYKVTPILGLVPSRVTFVLDAEGIVRHTFDSNFNMSKHMSEALAAVRSLTSKL